MRTARNRLTASAPKAVTWTAIAGVTTAVCRTRTATRAICASAGLRSGAASHPRAWTIRPAAPESSARRTALLALRAGPSAAAHARAASTAASTASHARASRTSACTMRIAFRTTGAASYTGIIAYARPCVRVRRLRIHSCLAPGSSGQGRTAGRFFHQYAFSATMTRLSAPMGPLRVPSPGRRSHKLGRAGRRESIPSVGPHTVREGRPSTNSITSTPTPLAQRGAAQMAPRSRRNASICFAAAGATRPVSTRTRRRSGRVRRRDGGAQGCKRRVHRCSGGTHRRAPGDLVDALGLPSWPERAGRRS
jgi:hypothetical protein